MTKLGGGKQSNALEFVRYGLLWAIVELNEACEALVRHRGDLVAMGDAIRGKWLTFNVHSLHYYPKIKI